MSKSRKEAYVRGASSVLESRILEGRRRIQVVAGARQVGKTTLVLQTLERMGLPHLYASADEPGLRGGDWIARQWDRARLDGSEQSAFILALDEVHKLPGWSESVKRMWDEDTRARRKIHLIVMGSAPLLIQQGLTESLAGRFETLPLTHWSLVEMRDAFGFTLEDFLYFGGYPGAAILKSDPQRWRRYVLDSLIETTISRDVLLLTRIEKPALLRRLFELGCRYSGQVLSYTKMLGQLQDAGNTTTLAHYLELLGGVGMLAGLQKYSGKAVRRRASSPKLQVLNTALMTAMSGLSPGEFLDDPALRGRLVESAAGAHLANASAVGECDLYYWREGSREVDFVVQSGRTAVAVEVKSGGRPTGYSSLEAFSAAFPVLRSLVVGGDGVPVAEFLESPVSRWFERV